MTNSTILNRATIKLITSAGALALVAGMSLSTAPQAWADPCLLDTSGDGNADSNVDTTLGATDGGVNARLACGSSATVTGPFGTAVGADSSATATDATALGNNANATGVDSTAIGQ